MSNYPDVDHYDPTPEPSVNDYYPEDDPMTNTNKHHVFVYGTLRKGHGNNRLLPEDTFIGTATTEDGYVMTAYSGFPAVYFPTYEDGDEGTIITGELYEVDDATLERLDGLEGHPRWYRREQVNVMVDGDDPSLGFTSAWIYIMQGERQGPVIESGDYNNQHATS